MTHLLSNDLIAKRDRLLEQLASFGSCAVAYSGGVDSAVVAKAAQLALGDAAIAVTGVSASLADGELEQAVALAKQIGIRHQQLDTDELANPAYAANAPDRCFHCKTELYTQLAGLAERPRRRGDRQRHQRRRPRRLSPRSRRGRQPPRPRTARRMRHHQSRRASPRGSLESPCRRQTGVALPLQPHRLRPSRHARAAAR